MRRILVLFCIVLEMSVLKASNFFVDGLGYTFIKDGEVEVTDQCFDTVGYSGKLVIPAYVPYGGGMHKVTRIGDNAIHSCHSLTSVTIPETVVAIGDFAFWNCTNLDSVVIPNSVLTIANEAFKFCTKLKSVVLSENLVVLGDCVFENCYSLPSLTIPNSVKYIGSYLSLGCDELKEIKIPAGVVFIGRNFWENVHVAYVANNVAEFCRSNGFNRSMHKGDGIIVDSVSYIIDGKKLKSINQFYNKQKAKYQSKLVNSKYSKRLRKLDIRNKNRVDDYINKAVNQVITISKENHVGKIVIGYNKGLKQKGVKSNLLTNKEKAKINQSFVRIPLSKLINKLKYKCEEYNITYAIVNESYTSISSFYDNDELDKITKYSGKRIKRGLYLTKNNMKVNADVNAALNILRKSKPNDDVINHLRDSGLTIPKRLQVSL